MFLNLIGRNDGVIRAEDAQANAAIQEWLMRVFGNNPNPIIV